MNKFKTLCISASLLVLLGFSGCKKSDTKRERLEEGYRLVEKSGGEVTRKFVHDHKRNEDFLQDFTDYTIYLDKRCDKCDNKVDLYRESNREYHRGVSDKEELFKKVDEDYARKKKEMGVK